MIGAKPWVGRVPDAVEYGRGGTSIRARGPGWGAYAVSPRVPGRAVGPVDHSSGRNPGRRNPGGRTPWCVDDRGETPGGPGTRCGRIRSGRYIHSGPGARLVGGVCRCAPGVRPGLWSTGPTARPGTGERPVGAPNHSQGRNPWAANPWAAKPLVCGRSGRTPWAGRVSGQLPCPGRGRPQTPGLSYVLIGISVRLHLAFASGFLSVCEGKGLYLRRACQYVILRISSRPCTWPECSFYGRPICCLSAPYASRGVPEIREP